MIEPFGNLIIAHLTFGPQFSRNLADSIAS
jgi:hypothetical protein